MGSIVHVALAANRNYYAGLLATVVSLLEANRRSIFHLHVIDGGLTPNQHRELAAKASRRQPANRVSFHTLNHEIFRGFKADYGNSYMTYARIVVASVVEADRVIYLDTDLLVAADVAALWDEDLGNAVVAAAPDRGIGQVREDYPYPDGPGDARYFNAGVLVINLTRWRRQGVQDALLRMITANPERFRWWDQTAMNVLLHDQVHFLDRSWNTFADEFDLSVPEHGRIFHYVGGTKPWTRYLDTPEFHLWRRFYRQHANSGGSLYLNRRMLGSYAQHLRHRTLSRSPLLQASAACFLRARAALRGSDGVAAVREFRARHTAATPLQPADQQIDAFIRARWGEP
jgi:lipopolysaccharide biosynthesis glycosyltransferase